MLLSQVSNEMNFIKRSTTKTPDVMAETVGEVIYFEVTRLIDMRSPDSPSPISRAILLSSA